MNCVGVVIGYGTLLQRWVAARERIYGQGDSSGESGSCDGDTTYHCFTGIVPDHVVSYRIYIIAL